MRFYEEHNGEWKDVAEEGLVEQFEAWRSTHPRQSETSLGILWVAFLISLGEGWAWDPAAERRLFTKVLTRRVTAEQEDPSVCDDCGRPEDMCECGLGACQGHGGGR